MAFVADFEMTQIAEQASNDLLQAKKGTHFLFNNIDKSVLPQGQATISYPGITARAAETRVEGGALAAVTNRVTTSVSYTPQTEYLSRIAIDRISAGLSYYDLYQANKDTVMTEIIDGLSSALWTEVGSFTNTTGVSGTVNDISVLHTARQKLMALKAWTSKQWICATGTEEMSDWVQDLTIDTAGAITNDAMAMGFVGQYAGFRVGEDQDRSGTYDTDAISIAMHPSAIKAVFRNGIDYVSGINGAVPTGMFFNEQLGFPVFSEVRQMNNSTGGVGVELHIFTIADIGILDDDLAVQILG